jgi:hypothetical protein
MRSNAAAWERMDKLSNVPKCPRSAPAPAESMLTKKNAIYNLPRYSNIMLMEGRLHPENDLDSLLVL